jgi:Fe2+ or Zn2+ uptake regulation protein
VTLNDYSLDIEPPSLWEVLQLTRDAGLVGEENTVLTVVLSFIRGHLVVMSGMSRAGKDAVVDAAQEGFPSSKMVYQWPADDSETAAFYNRAEINQYPVHRFPDLARLPDHQERILKSFGEGRDATRQRTDMAAEKRGDDPVEDQVLTAPHTVVAFIASDNENINLNDYPELRNRALIVSVDASEEQTHRVNRRKALEHAGLDQRRISPIRKAEIQDYHASIPVDAWVDSPSAKIINPAALNIHEQEPIPELFPEARQDFDRLLEFMETVALYHYAERAVYEDNGSRRMLVAPVDVWEAMTVLGNKMVMSALNLREEDRAILSLLRESKSNLSKAEIQQSLRTQGFNITDRDVRRSLDSMNSKGYVRVHQGNPNEYSLNEFASVTQHEAGLDYQQVVDAASEKVYEVAPDPVADEYVDRFCQGDGLITTHPLTGEAVDITEANELDEMVDDGIEGVEEVFDEAMADVPTSDDSDDDEPPRSTETQARLT